MIRYSVSNKRIIMKTIIYRGIVTAILFGVSWVFTGNLIDTTTITVIFNVLATIAYFFHEKMWDKISWGRERPRLEYSDKLRPKTDRA
jgi:uncharacterized membrane protein